jgi:hypothetical protein
MLISLFATGRQSVFGQAGAQEPVCVATWSSLSESQLVSRQAAEQGFAGLLPDHRVQDQDALGFLLADDGHLDLDSIADENGLEEAQLLSGVGEAGRSVRYVHAIPPRR